MNPDRTFTCTNPATRRPTCRYGLAELGGSPTPVVVLIELPDNPGMSITNNVERAIVVAAQALGVGVDDAVWVEHYAAEPGPRSARPHATYDRVTLDGGTPRWRAVRAADWAAWGVEPPPADYVDLTAGGRR